MRDSHKGKTPRVSGYARGASPRQFSNGFWLAACVAVVVLFGLLSYLPWPWSVE